jgi:hypothetical protein
VVGQQPGGQCEQGHPEQACERDDASLGGRAGQREHQEWVRDRRHIRPAAREQLRPL